MFHISAPEARDLTAPIGPGAPIGTNDSAVRTVPVDGIGDSAMFLFIPVNGGTLLSLRVQSGSDIYAFNAQDDPEAQATLLALANAVLSAQS
jgi:hypothetical protein